MQVNVHEYARFRHQYLSTSAILLSVLGHASSSDQYLSTRVQYLSMSVANEKMRRKMIMTPQSLCA